MLEVILSLVYHVISVTYVQFLTITSIFYMENCKRYLTVNPIMFLFNLFYTGKKIS